MPWPVRLARGCALVLALLAWAGGLARAQELPDLAKPVNDFAGVVDPTSAAEMDRMIRTLQAATGDVVVVATIETFAPYGDIREYAVKLFANRGRGVGDKAKDNGLLILLAVKDRKVWVEVGYGLEGFITDGYAGETSRLFMAPEFRNGRYGAGLKAGAARIIGRIAEGRNVTLEGVKVPRPARRQGSGSLSPLVLLLILIAIVVLTRLSGGPGAPISGGRRWGRSGWSGWSSGVGSFGGGSGGFGGGFGGFGGGGSGGGGGGASW